MHYLFLIRTLLSFQAFRVFLILSNWLAQIEANLPSKCKEPDDLQETLEKLNAEIVTLHCTGTATYNIIPEYRNLSSFYRLHSSAKKQTIYGVSKCKQYKKRADPRFTCPWYVYLEYDEDRIPKTMAKAECTCRECFKVDSFEKSGLCEKVYTYVHVIRRHCIDGDFQYFVKLEPVPVGCTCKRDFQPFTEQHLKEKHSTEENL